MEFTENELDLVLDHMSKIVPDLEKHMEECFEAVMFLGNTVTSDDEVEDATLTTILLCERYFLLKEDYIKIRDLGILKNLIFEKKQSIVDDELIRQIKVNFN